jgi:UDP-glucose 4-epimerase
MSTIAVVGAASYEGRQLLLALGERGLDFQGFDGPESETHNSIIKLDLSSADQVREAFQNAGVRDVIHLPDRGTVARSLKDPLDAFETVLLPLMGVLRASAEGGARSFLLSSTASVYGIPERVPVPENARLSPISPLGAAAAAAERMTAEVCRGNALPFAILRYFNAAGADPIGRAGASDAPKHLITAAVHIALGLREGPLRIYGDDYPTPDGTPIRDYVHVADVASAHVDMIEHLRGGGRSMTLNCGYGEGASVLDVVRSVERVLGHPLPTVVEGRRAGDPPQLIADTAAIRSVLGWRPMFNDLDLIIRTAMDRERQQMALPAS